MITRLALPGIRDAADIAHIEKALEAVARVRSVTIDQHDEVATVEHDGADIDELKAAASSVGLRAELPQEESSRIQGAAGKATIILAPVDFSGVTDRVLAEASTLARMFRGRVVLVHVTEPTTGVVDYAAIVVAVAQVNEAAVKHATERLRQFEERLNAEGVETESVHLTGTPVSEILDHAEKLEADYIVMGSHGHTAFYDLLVGGTTHGVLKRAMCPVVIVPPPPEEKST